MTTALRMPIAALEWLGRQGTRAVAALVFIGIAVPPLGAILRPFVGEAIFALLCLAFLRLDTARLREYLRRPALVLLASGWTMLVIPAALGLSGVAFGVDRAAPELFLGLMLQSVAPPMMAAPAIVALMRLDSTPVLVTLVVSMVLTPLTAPLFAHVFAGEALSLSPSLLGLKLFGYLAGSALVAAVLRRVISRATIARRKDLLDGINILILLVFVSSVMGSMAGEILDRPVVALGLAVLAFAVVVLTLAATMFLFRKSGPARALALGVMAAQRNTGLMLAATAGSVPELVWLYFGFVQFPMYLLPQLLQPLARRATAAAAGGVRP
jgi:BASS family bile acid:Na+ symporter